MGLAVTTEGDMPLPTVKRGQHADRQSHRAAIAIGKQLHAIEELKRKVDAARLAGLRRVVLSPENAEDWHALPNAVKTCVEGVFVDNVQQLLAAMFYPLPQ
ncbi:hypothetical protein niasHT_036269 [Heterodera trifolii]|uniref:Lon proteolytic domain-containing protein n=1 Tax=Heterodera trifolii TaxID=157864 RepID=A0ABD2IEW2_9BILA